jgi:hypothetical protein
MEQERSRNSSSNLTDSRVTKGAVIHWLPFVAKRADEVVRCSVESYFVASHDSESTMKATFRGRSLRGVHLDTTDFHPYVNSDISTLIRSRVHMSEEDIQPGSGIVIWNHDDLPLKSDVIQQAVNLARVQNFLGLQSGIE